MENKEIEMSRGNRPDFSREFSIQEFERHYWYKKDLIDICRINNISSSRTF
jgi:hypothetical protein